MKDFLTSKLLKVFINHHFKKYGHMTTLHIDSEARLISLSADLSGEVAPLEAKVAYSIEETEGQMWFVPQTLDCSREWLSLLGQQLLKDNAIRVAIPPGIATALVKMLKM